MSEVGKQSTKKRGRRGATLADVATEAGVSIAAASFVLNGSQTATRVSALTRERILNAAAALNYVPNSIARSLRQKSTEIIAFYNAQSVAFTPTYPFYAAIWSGIGAGCTEHKKDLLIHANFQGRSDDDIFHGLHNGQIDGLVLYARTVTPLVKRLLESHLPIVTVAEEVPGLPYVGIDEHTGGQMLAQHLATKGYRNVLYRCLIEKAASANHQERKAAFYREAEKLGLNVTTSAYDPASNLPTPEEEKLLLKNKGERPDAIVCWSDASADGVVAFCLQRGMRVPEDIAIVGFDGLLSSRRPSLKLTTIFAPWEDVARTAVGILAAQCEGKETPPRTILPVELIVGDTT